ncbi:MAG: 2OG-Fe(II) oxygenase family protein [Pseudomonadota bacterium]
MLSILNPDVDGGFDLQNAAAVFKTHGHVRLAGVMVPERAEAIAKELLALQDWALSYGVTEGVGRVNPAEIASWPEDTRKAFNQTLVESARKGDGFAYFSSTLDGSDGQGPLPPSAKAMGSELMDPALLAFINSLTGLTGDVSRVDASVTQFRPGHYLTRHTDKPQGQDRKLAFVWGLTPNWHPDWGGLLQFYQPDGSPNLAFAPGLNTLDLFSVEKIHAVTYVAPFAGGPRQAVSGWYLG